MLDLVRQQHYSQFSRMLRQDGRGCLAGAAAGTDRRSLHSVAADIAAGSHKFRPTANLSTVLAEVIYTTSLFAELPQTVPSVRSMTATRPPPFFIAENMGLDFLNSIAVPVDTKVEWLTSGKDLLVWLKQAALVPEDVLDTFRKSALPGELDAIAAQARALRDWFKPFVYKHMGRPIEPNALRQLEPLNRLLGRDEQFGQIVVRDRLYNQEHDHGHEKGGISGLAWRPQRRWHSPESLLLPIARSLADLVCGEDFTYVKACEGPECTLLFIDRTRGRARRWCSMAICGNRAKQAAHRERAQQTRMRKG